MLETPPSNPFEAYFAALNHWLAPAASQNLSQAILPGWSLISVNASNSSAPDTEQAIVAKASYGRQLGRLLDAVEELIAERPDGAEPKKAFTELSELADSIDKAKVDAARARIMRLRSDLDLLKASAPEEYRTQCAALAGVLADG